MKLGELIRTLRQARGMRQAHLARDSGTSQQHIAHIERGHIKHPSLYLLQRIADTLKVDLSVLADTAGLKYHKDEDSPSTLLAKLQLVMPETMDIIEDIMTGETEGKKIAVLREDFREGIVATRVRTDWKVEIPTVEIGEVIIIDREKKPMLKRKKSDMVLYLEYGKKPILKYFSKPERSCYGVVVGKYVMYE
jgi:transcriptional regulator with XRE-family HTH domain